MYQVLARKWRPRDFHELVGQAHVTQALTYALDHDRLHHAYLFTGTRGVGKTTIARIFAKSLNCLTNGVSSNPCGECAHCTEIEQGRFPDLIEVDAASRTGVDDTRELLDNVPYAPVKGRYKVYLIDEVHMFSKSSFNALLKTLEEPPAHVKFILATTDPQKLPATVLSRCLQFHLKNMNERQIVGQMRTVLDGEQITYEDEAVRLIAQAANGSMRDGLSLLDQAIAYGQGHIRVEEVANLLGAIPTTQLHHLLKALVLGDAKALRAQLQEIDEFAPDYGDILARLLAQLQLITIAQLKAEQTLGEVGEFIRGLADALPVELVQLWYQIATDTWRNLPYQPDARMALEMGLLRMIALQPVMPNDALANVKPIASADKPILAEDAPTVSAMADSLDSDSKSNAVPEIEPSLGSVNIVSEQREKKNSTLDESQPANISTNNVGEDEDDGVVIAQSIKDAPTLMPDHNVATLVNVPMPKQSYSPPTRCVSDDYEPPWVEPLGKKITDADSTHKMATNDTTDSAVTTDNNISKTGDADVKTNAIIDMTDEPSSANTTKLAITERTQSLADNVSNSVKVAFNQPETNRSANNKETTSTEEMDEILQACIGQPERWEALIKQIDFSGEALMLADFSLPSAWRPPMLTLSCQEGNDAWVTSGRCQAVANAISHHFGKDCVVVVEKQATVDTPHRRKLAKEEKRIAKAKQDFLQHPQVQQIVELFGAQVDINSIKILDESKESL